MLFNWWKKKTRAPGDEWPQFTEDLTDPLMSQGLHKARLHSHPDNLQARPKTCEDVVAAARLVY